MPSSVVCALCCSALVVMFLQRSCVQEILQLMRMDAVHPNQKHYIGNCTFVGNKKYHLRKTALEYYWSWDLVQNIRQAFFIGYITCQIPVGVLSDRGGPRRILVSGMLLSSVLCLTLPVLASLGPLWFMAGYFIQGIGQSVVFPCSISAIAQWAPFSRHATYTGITISGMNVGIVIAQVYFNRIFPLVGWRIALYIPGLFGFGWCLLWLVLSRSFPPPSLLVLGTSQLQDSQIERRRVEMTRAKILCSPPFISLIILNCGQSWFHLHVLNNWLEPYLHYVLHLPEHLSMVSSIVVLATVPMTVASGFLSDWLVDNSFITRTLCRRLFVFLGSMVPGTLLYLTPLLGCNHDLFIALQVVVFYFKGFVEGTVYVNNIDLSTKHAGLLTAVMKTIGIFFALSSRRIFDVAFPEGSESWWRATFFLSTPLITVLTVPFLMYGSGEQQTRSPIPSMTL